MSWSPQRLAQSQATLEALEERLGAEESRSERAEVRAVFLEVRLGAAERAVEKATLALSPERGRLVGERLWRDEVVEEQRQAAGAGQAAAAERHSPGNSAANLAAALSPSTVASMVSSPGTGMADQLAAAEARAASLEAERLTLRGRLAASDARAEALAERDALQRELVVERAEREQAEAEAETLELRQRLLLVERSNEETLEAREVQRMPVRDELDTEEEWNSDPVALRYSHSAVQDHSLQEECDMLRRQLVNEGRRRGRLEAKVAALERERDKLWEQLSTEETRRVQVEAQASAFGREWDAARERLAAEQLRRERAEEERNSLLHSSGLGSQSPDSPLWRWQPDQRSKASLLSTDHSTWPERLATEEAKMEEAEMKAASLKDDVVLLSERLASLEAGIGLAPSVQASLFGSQADHEGVEGLCTFTELLPNERARLEWAEARVLVLERQLAEATHTSQTRSEPPVGYCLACRRKLEGQVDVSADPYTEPEVARTVEPQQQKLQMADRVAAQRQALLPWKGGNVAWEETGRRVDMVATDAMRQELADAKSQAAQEAACAAQEKQQLLARLGAEVSRASVEAAEASVLRERLSDAEAHAALGTRRAVHDESVALKSQFEPILESMQKQLESHQRAHSALREELALEGSKRTTDSRELSLLRDRLASSELDAATQRALLEERSSLQQQLAPIVHATQLRMQASKEDCSALRGQLAAEEDKWMEEATEVVALRRRLADAELDAERAVDAAAEEGRQLSRERGRGAAEVAACRRQVGDVEQEAERALRRAVQEESAALQEQLAPVVEAAQQQIAAYREDHAALRGRLEAEAGERRAEASRAAALGQRLREAELEAGRALQRAVQEEALAARQHGRWHLLVARAQHCQQLEAHQEDCLALRLELRAVEDRGASHAAAAEHFARALDSAELGASRAAADAERRGGRLEAEESRSRAEAAEAAALRRRLADAEQDVERSLCRAVQAESVKLHKRFTPIVEAAQQQLEACQEDCVAARKKLEEEENSRTLDAAEMAVCQRRMARQEAEARAALEAALEDCSAAKGLLVEEEARRASEVEGLRERLRAVEQGAQEDAGLLRSEALGRERVAAAALDAEKAARGELQEEREALQEELGVALERTRQQADAFREDLEVAARGAHAAEEKLACERGRRGEEEAEVGEARQRLAAAERGMQLAARRAAEEEAAIVRGQMSLALEVVQRQLEASREECCSLWGELAAEQGRSLGEAAEASALRGRLGAAKMEALEAARRAVQEEGAAMHQRLAPIVDASREDCFALRRQLAVEEGARAGEAAELAGLRQRLAELEVDAEEATLKAVHAEGAALQSRYEPAVEAMQQERLALQRELVVQQGEHAAASADVAASRRQLEEEGRAVGEAARRAGREEAAASEARRHGAAEAAALRQRLEAAEAGAERAVRGAVHEEGTALQRWLAPLLEASQEDCAALRGQLAEEERRRRAKAAEVVQLRQRLARLEPLPAEAASPLPPAEAASPEGRAVEYVALTPSASLGQAGESLEHLGLGSERELQLRLAAEEDRGRAEAAELAAVRAILVDTEADAERGLSLIMEASQEDRYAFWRELSAEEGMRVEEAAEVATLRQELLDSRLDVEQDSARETDILRRQLAEQQGRLDELKEACHEELEAQALHFRHERDELRHELAAVIANHRQELLQERLEAQQALGESDLGVAPAVSPRSDEAFLLSSFKKRLAAADQASQQQLGMDIELEKELVMRALGHRPCQSSLCAPGTGQLLPHAPVSC